MLKFDIAGILIEIDSDKHDIFDQIKSFSSLRQDKPDVKVHLKSSNRIYKPQGDVLFDEENIWIRNSSGDESLSVCICREESDEVIAVLEVNADWSCATVTYLKNNVDGKYAIIGALGEILFFYGIIFHQGIVMHASAIEWNGRGIIFSAPSGTGKSTQANLWSSHMGARILNGDRPAIRALKDKSYVYGTPWSGSSSEFLNGCVGLSAVVILEQSMVNTIRRLDEHEAVCRLMPRCFLPYFDSKLMSMAISNLEKVIITTPVYLMGCKPDREAVELVYECIR